jgi:ATP-dependent DNA helicase RecQ
VKATAADTVFAPAGKSTGSGEAMRASHTAPVVHDPLLFERLRSLRRTIAEERGVPPYLIFSDASLRDMVQRHPTTLEQFLEVKGVGEWKSQAFGERFLALLRQTAS